MISKKIQGLVLVASCSSISAFAAFTDAASAKITIYDIAVSTSATCSNPTVIMSFAGGREVDFVQNPDLGGGSIPDGTYPCVILHMSDVIKFVPATTTGNCTAGQEYTRDICRTGSNYTPITVSGKTGTLGSTTGCSGAVSSPSEDKVSLFLSTGSSGTGSTAFLQPTTAGSSNGLSISGPLVVSGTASGTFVVDMHNKIDGGQSPCDMGPATFSFR